uniref:Uncharacterized protein n=1 Tax=Parastrongyloides trichosuri TaxID=131310 RepID=A0A0N4ZP95_PARTI
MKNIEDRKPFLPSYQHSRPHYLINKESSSPEVSPKPMYRGRQSNKPSDSSSTPPETSSDQSINYKHIKRKNKNYDNIDKKESKNRNKSNPQRGNVSFHNVSYKLTNLSEDEVSDDEEGSQSSAENSRLMDSEEDERYDTKHDQPPYLNTGGSQKNSRLTQRRFTLNPLIFAKEERDARRQSLAQLKLSYYPSNAHRKFFVPLN